MKTPSSESNKYESNTQIDPDYRLPEWQQPEWDYPYPPPVGNENYSPFPLQWERPPHSMWGIFSLVLSLFSALGGFVLVCICVWIGIEHPEILEQEPPHLGVALTGLGIIGCCVAQLVALAFGIVGLCEPRTRKGFALAGVFFSVLAFGFTMALVVIGLMMD